MREVEGWQTEDGEFFQSPVEAELHEALVALIAAAEVNGFRPDAAVQAAERFGEEIMRYINAYASATADQTRPAGPEEIFRRQQAERARHDHTPGESLADYARRHDADTVTGRSSFARPSIRQSNQDNRRAEENTPSEFKLPTRGRQPMRDLRRSGEPAPLRDDGTFDGLGSGDGDASSVRRREDMATRTQATLTKALRERREAYLRGDEMEQDSERGG